MPIDMKLVDPAMQGPLDPIGHNAGSDLEARISELELAYDRAPDTIDNIETARRMADFCRQIDVCLKRADEARKAEKKPHDAAGAAVQAKYRDMTKVLQVQVSIIRARLRVWMEQTGTQTVRSDYGAVASLREGCDVIFDRDALAWSAIHRFISDEAIEKAIQAALEAGAKNIEGVRIVDAPSLQVR